MNDLPNVVCMEWMFQRVTRSDIVHSNGDTERTVSRFIVTDTADTIARLRKMGRLRTRASTVHRERQAATTAA